jgi:hypothetical protein
MSRLYVLPYFSTLKADPRYVFYVVDVTFSTPNTDLIHVGSWKSANLILTSCLRRGMF